MKKNEFLKSNKGLTLVKLVLIIIVLMLLAGVSTYVALINNTGNNVNLNDEPVNTINQVEEETL